MAGRELGEVIRPFEVLAAQPLTEGRPIVARLVGRKFESLGEGKLETPFDPRLGKVMLKTLAHLCTSLGASYGYCERTEMSLFAVSNGGEARRLLSRIGGEAAAKMSLLLGEIATFEARLYEFTCADETWDYFRWRSEENQAAALDAYCSHVLEQSGSDAARIPTLIGGMDHEEKLELLRQNALDFAALPAWQRLGAGVYVPRDGGTAAVGRLVVDLNLPNGDDYPDYLKRFVA